MNLKSLKKTIRDEEKPVKDFEIIDEKEEKITNKNKDQNIEKFSHIKEENSNLRKKIRKYNEKLAQANKKILELLQEKAGFIEKLKTTSEKDEYLNNYKEDLPFMTKEKPNKLMNQTFDKRLNYKDELLLDEINRNINKGMQFYKL